MFIISVVAMGLLGNTMFWKNPTTLGDIIGDGKRTLVRIER